MNERKLTNTFRCVVCGKPAFDQMGHDPEPIKNYGRCCEACYLDRVMPLRIERAAGIPELG